MLRDHQIQTIDAWSIFQRASLISQQKAKKVPHCCGTLLLIKVHLLECTLSSLLSLGFVSSGQSTAPLGRMLLHYKWKILRRDAELERWPWKTLEPLKSTFSVLSTTPPHRFIDALTEAHNSLNPPPVNAPALGELLCRAKSNFGAEMQSDASAKKRDFVILFIYFI